MRTSTSLILTHNSSTIINMHTFGCHKATRWIKVLGVPNIKGIDIKNYFISVFLFHDLKTSLLFIHDSTSTIKVAIL